MTSQAEQQITSIHRFHSISRNTGNQTMKFDQLIQYNVSNAKNEAKNEAGRLVPDVFLFFIKLYIG